MREYFIWLAKILTIVVLVVIGIPILFGALVGMAHVMSDVSKPGGGKKKNVAVIELNGVIESSKEVVQQLYDQVENAQVKGIVLRIDSPGGAVGPSQEIYDTVRKLKGKKPIVASMGTVAASGGLYSALGASKIFCEPGTLTGSIGVIMQLPNFTKIIEKLGVDMITVKSGKFKDVGNSFREMTVEDRAFLETTIQTVYESFLNAVVESRGIPREEALKFADGRVIVGTDALKYRLIDEFGGVYEASRAVFEILGEPLPEGEIPNLIYPGETLREFRKALSGASNLLNLLNPMNPKLQMYFLMQ